MEEVARIVLALETQDVAEEVMHFLDRTGRARVVGTAIDGSQLTAAIRQLEPDAVVATPSMVGSRESLNGSALLAVDTSQSVGTLRRAIRAGASGLPMARRTRRRACRGAAPGARHAQAERAPVLAVRSREVQDHVRGDASGGGGARRERRCAGRSTWCCGRVGGGRVPVDGGPDDAEPGAADELRRSTSRRSRRHPSGFGVLLAPGDGLARVRAEDYRRAIAATRRTCDVVVLHIPRALDEVAQAGLEAADRVLIVLGLDVLSFRDAKRAIEATGLEDRCAFVVNRASRSEIAPRDVERVFGQAPLAVIPSDRAVRSAQNRGRLLPARGRVARAVDRIARTAIEVPA
jgi:hypothetical protein